MDNKYFFNKYLKYKKKYKQLNQFLDNFNIMKGGINTRSTWGNTDPLIHRPIWIPPGRQSISQHPGYIADRGGLRRPISRNVPRQSTTQTPQTRMNDTNQSHPLFNVGINEQFAYDEIIQPQPLPNVRVNGQVPYEEIFNEHETSNILNLPEDYEIEQQIRNQTFKINNLVYSDERSIEGTIYSIINSNESDEAAYILKVYAKKLMPNSIGVFRKIFNRIKNIIPPILISGDINDIDKYIIEPPDINLVSQLKEYGYFFYIRNNNFNNLHNYLNENPNLDKPTLDSINKSLVLLIDELVLHIQYICCNILLPNIAIDAQLNIKLYDLDYLQCLNLNDINRNIFNEHQLYYLSLLIHIQLYLESKKFFPNNILYSVKYFEDHVFKTQHLFNTYLQRITNPGDPNEPMSISLNLYLIKDINRTFIYNFIYNHLRINTENFSYLNTQLAEDIHPTIDEKTNNILLNLLNFDKFMFDVLRLIFNS